jgi:hypothetical protein
LLQVLDDQMALNQLAAGMGAPLASDAQPDGRRLHKFLSQTQIKHAENPLGVKYAALVKDRAGAAALSTGKTGRNAEWAEQTF